METFRNPSVPEVEAFAAGLWSPPLRAAIARSPAAFARFVEVRRYRYDELISSPERAAKGLYLVALGSVAVSLYGRERVASRGSTFGAYNRPDADLPIHDMPHLAVMRGVQVWARALTDAEIWFLDAEAFIDAGRAVPGLAEAMQFLHLLRGDHEDCAQALSRPLRFRAMDRDEIMGLVERAEPVTVPPGELLYGEGATNTGVYVLLRGGLTVQKVGANENVQMRLDPGSVCGDVETLMGEPAAADVRADTPALLGRLPPQLFATAFRVSPGLRRPAEASDFRRRVLLNFESSTDPELLLLQSDTHLALANVTRVLTAMLRADWGDPVLVCELAPAGSAPVFAYEDGVPRLRLPIDRLGARCVSDTLCGEIERALRPFDHCLDQFAQVYLDPFALGAAALVAPAVTRPVYIAKDPLAPLALEPLQNLPMVRCALLGTGVSLAGRLPVRTARLRLPLDPGTTLAGLSPTARDAVARLARAVTDRRIGVALGGGGAWGYAHAALLTALTSGPDALPIDVVAGASFGSLLGAYWCCKGAEGLDLLTRHGVEANRAVALGMISSRSLSLFVNHDLDSRLLEDLDVPLFPVATDVVYEQAFVPRSGTVGFGVRCSSAFPPSLTAVLFKDMRLVDGGFVNNVPASVVVQEGADLVIASNIVSTAPRRQMSTTRLGPIGRFWSAFSPIQRGLDTARSAFGVFHATGVAESQSADIVFEPSFSTPDFWDMTKGPSVIAAAKESAEMCAAQAKKEWRERCSPLLPSQRRETSAA